VTIFNGWFLVLLGDATPSPSPSSNEPDASLVSPGWLGFVSLVFLSVTVFVIWKSMNRQFKKIDFDEAATERPRKSSATSSPGVALTNETPADPAQDPAPDDIFEDGSDPASQA
jgi:hypothetical protein